jgi:hypothetical protein
MHDLQLIRNNIVTCILIARKRLAKHIPAEANARNNKTSISRQQTSKHASLTTEGLSSLCGPCREVINGYSQKVSGSSRSIVVESEVKGRASRRQPARI